jgi:class 3 adenylate cyclase/tetratricopeptide (TPR) repeat protein
MSTDTRLLIAGLEARLRRYLPDQLLSPLQSHPSVATARACDAHLSALLRAVSTYLPRYLVQEILRDPIPGQVSGRFRETTIMFADISGFTAMSERLSRRGEEGAEKITNIVGDYFTTMLDLTARQGGDLLKFGGDALLVAFFGQDHAIRACRAGAQMQQAIARFSEVEAFGETFRLKMTVGLGSGPLFTANLGTAEKMEYTVMGEALANMAYAEDQAEGGEIFIDQATYGAVQSLVRVGETRNGCYLVTDVAGCESCPDEIASVKDLMDSYDREGLHESSLSATVSHLADGIAYLDALVPFLPPGLLGLLRFNPLAMASRERGEFRPVTVIFANFYGIDEIIGELGPGRAAEITGTLNAHFSKMQEIINRYEGVIDKVDSYVVGHRIMALFGAPRAHVDDPERAVRTAWEMQAAMSAFSELETSAGTFALKQRIGINTGRVFAGNVGSEMRHEYSVMGDEVNLTARLMSAAKEDQVLISQSTAAQVGKRFHLDEKDPVKVKGKSQPVPNYEVTGVVKRHQTGELPRRSPLIGRNPEWQVIWKTAQQAIAGHTQALDLHGEMGMGKSRIIEELLDHWTRDGRTALFGPCLSYSRHTPYAPWIAILRDLFGLRDDDTDQERREKIASLLTAANPDWGEWAALIGQLLGVPMAESELLRSLDPKLRQQNLQRIVSGLVAWEAARRPLLLVLDDVQWIDEVSLALLNHLSARAQPVPLLVCIAYRPDEPLALDVTCQDHCTTVGLQPLSEASSLELLNSQLPTEPEMPRRLKEVILKNAQGNPLFIVEMAHALIENYLSYDADAGVYRAREDLDRVQVPDTVSRVILSRLDRLDEQSRSMLKVASVIGRAFQQWLLQSVYPYQAQVTEIETHLNELCQRDILDHAEVVYLFRHVMTREVAYESLLYAERRDLHRKIAQSIVEQIRAHAGHIDEYLEVLAEHCTLAEDWPNALTYHLRAGQRARAIYANQDAVHRYQQVLDVAQHVPDSLAERVTAHEGLGDVYDVTGQYDESLAHYAQARQALREMPPSAAIQRCRADLCRKTGWIYERKGDFEEALEWVQRGLALLGAEGCIETARLHLLRAGIHHRQGANREAIRWCQRAIEITERGESEDHAQETAHAAFLMGEIYRRLGDYDRAIQSAQRSLGIYQDLENIVGQGEAYNTLGNAYGDKYDWAASTDHFQKGLALKERIGESYGQGALALNIGENYRVMGQLEQAIAYYGRSLQVWEELGATYPEGLTHNNLGAAYLRLGDLERAADHLVQSETLFAQIPSEDFVAETSRYWAEVALRQGRADDAMAFARRSLKYSQEQELRSDECAARRVLGTIHLERGELERAKTYLHQSLDIAHELDDHYELGKSVTQLGLLLRAQGRPGQAEALLNEARMIFRDLDARLDLEEVEELIGSS